MYIKAQENIQLCHLELDLVCLYCSVVITIETCLWL